MSPIASVTSAKPAAMLGANTPTASRLPQKTLGQDDFLKLLASQFRTQDPMKPMEDTAFIAQMAQFTALEQSSSMAETLAVIRSDQTRATANSYLGRRVTVGRGEGEVDTGEVTTIDVSGSEPQLVVKGVRYPLSAVLSVEQGAATITQLSRSGGG